MDGSYFAAYSSSLSVPGGPKYGKLGVKLIGEDGRITVGVSEREDDLPPLDFGTSSGEFRCTVGAFLATILGFDFSFFSFSLSFCSASFSFDNFAIFSEYA